MSPNLATTIPGLVAAIILMVKLFVPETMGPMLDKAGDFIVALAVFLIGYFANKTNETMPKFMRKG